MDSDLGRGQMGLGFRTEDPGTGPHCGGCGPPTARPSTARLLVHLKRQQWRCWRGGISCRRWACPRAYPRHGQGARPFLRGTPFCPGRPAAWAGMQRDQQTCPPYPACWPCGSRAVRWAGDEQPRCPCSVTIPHPHKCCGWGGAGGVLLQMGGAWPSRKSSEVFRERSVQTGTRKGPTCSSAAASGLGTGGLAVAVCTPVGKTSGVRRPHGL